MPEEFIDASTGDAAPAFPGVETPQATSAGSEGAGVEAVTQPVGEASATPAADGSIDIGWSLDLGEESKQPDASIPENDDDIEQLVQEPGVDQERVPGVVTALKTARSRVRELTLEVSKLNNQYAALTDFGGVEGITQMLKPFAPLLRNEEGGANGLLEALWNHAQPAYKQLADAVVLQEPEYVLGKLREAGLIPDTSHGAAAPTASQLTPEVMASIPEHLQPVAKRLAVEQPEVLEDLLLQTEGVRNYNLEREAKLAQLDETQQKHARTEWDTKVQVAQTAGLESMRSLSQQYEQAHFRELDKWKPYGDDAEGNTEFHREVVEGAFAKILRDEKFARMYDDAQQMIREAPLLRLQGQGYKADDNERKARQYAMQFNTRLGQIMKARIEKHNSIFADALKWRESQRQQVPSRTEISRSTQISSDRAGKTLTKDGRLSQDYLEEIAASVSG